MLWVLAVIVGAAVAVAWWRLGRRATDRRRRSGERERAEVAAGAFARSAPVAPRPQRRSGGLLAAFRSDEMPIQESHEREDRRRIASALAMAADQLGAAQCVLWQLSATDDGNVEAVACARGDEPPVLAPNERAWLDAILDGDATPGAIATGDPRLLMTFIRVSEGRGVLSMHFADAPPMDAPTLHTRFTRHVEYITMVTELVIMRAELARRNAKLRAMMSTAKLLQGSRDPKSLETQFVQNALQVGRAEWAILVRWEAAERLARPKELTEAAPQFWALATARQSSIVGDVCLTGESRTFTDARGLVGLREPVFDDSPLPVGIGSFVVVPLRRSDEEPPLGALLCAHSRPGALNGNDAAALRELGVVAAGALETAWAVQEATARAHTDQLTALPNRRDFEVEFARAITETDRYGGTSALVIVDIDFFKQVNDTHGHEAGDAVLVAVGNLLRAERRETDKVARIGGEEFALLLPQTDAAGAIEVAERLRQNVEQLKVATATGTIGVTASFGVAMYAARSATGGRLFERADKALYAAKHGGRNRVELAPAEGAWSA